MAYQAVIWVNSALDAICEIKEQALLEEPDIDLNTENCGLVWA
jgi:hypothetical protein